MTAIQYADNLTGVFVVFVVIFSGVSLPLLIFFFSSFKSKELLKASRKNLLTAKEEQS